MVSETTDLRERVEVAEGDEPADGVEAATPQAEPRVLSLKERMAAIRRECSGIGKDDIQMESAKGSRFTIKGHTVEAVLSEVRPLFDKHGVDIWPNLVERTYAGNRCDVLVDWTFERTDDSDQTRVIRWGGSGTDNSDKGFSKAGTNCLKEMLKKTFLITDRDDAKEETESVEHRTEEGASKAEVEKVKEQRRAAIEQWAKAFKMGLERAQDEKDIARLERENRDQLMSDDLPEVTRTFFVELIQTRKAALKA